MEGDGKLVVLSKERVQSLMEHIWRHRFRLPFLKHVFSQKRVEEPNLHSVKAVEDRPSQNLRGRVKTEGDHVETGGDHEKTGGDHEKTQVVIRELFCTYEPFSPLSQQEKDELFKKFNDEHNAIEWLTEKLRNELRSGDREFDPLAMVPYSSDGTQIDPNMPTTSAQSEKFNKSDSGHCKKRKLQPVGSATKSSSSARSNKTPVKPRAKSEAVNAKKTEKKETNPLAMVPYKPNGPQDDNESLTSGQSDEDNERESGGHKKTIAKSVSAIAKPSLALRAPLRSTKTTTKPRAKSVLIKAKKPGNKRTSTLAKVPHSSNGTHFDPNVPSTSAQSQENNGHAAGQRKKRKLESSPASSEHSPPAERPIRLNNTPSKPRAKSVVAKKTNFNSA